MAEPIQSVGKLGEPYTNLPSIYQTQSFDEDAYKQAELKSKYGTSASQRDVRKFDRYMKSDAGVKALESARTTHNAAEHQKWSSSYSDYAAAIAAQSKARMLAAKQGFDNAVKKFDAPVEETPYPTNPPTNPPAKPQTLISRSEADWNRIASEATNGQLKTMADVEAWQRANGFSEDQIDGKFGNYSKSYFDQHSMGSYVDPIEAERLAKEKAATEEAAKQQAWVNHMRGLGYKEVIRDDGTRHFTNGNATYYNNGRAQIGNEKVNYDYTTLTRTPAGSSTFDLESWAKHNKLTTKYFDGKLYARYDPSGDGDFWVDTDGNVYESGLFGGLGHVIDKSFQNAYYKPTSIRGKHFNDLSNLLKVPYNKQGGTMNRINYFQQGGAAPQQQDVKAQVTALVQAAMQGDQKATETVNKIMEAAKAGDQQALQLAQMIQEVAKQMQGQATAAKWGAKLGYVRSLKYAKGGKTCHECEKKVEMKACGGKKAKKKYFGGLI